MPKTNEKDAYPFSHDCSARNDPKILTPRFIYGAEGYGVYFMLIGISREQPEYKLPITRYIWNTITMQMQMEASKLKQIIMDCRTELSSGGNNILLVNDGEYLHFASLLQHMGKVDDISKLRRETAKKRWENQLCRVSDGSESSNKDASVEQKVSKERERRENQSKVKQSKAKEKKEKETIFSDLAGEDAKTLVALRDLEEMRVKIKKPMTDRAKKLMLAGLRKLSEDREEQIAILDQSVKRSWAGVFALEDDRGYQQPRGGRQQTSTGEKMRALWNLHDAFSGEGEW